MRKIIFWNAIKNDIRENETNTKYSEEIGALAESLKIFQKYKVISI